LDNISESEIKKFTEDILEWYSNQNVNYPWRGDSVSTYVKILAEIFLQQTNRETVSKILPKFINEFPDWKSIDNASIETLQDTIKPLGLWRRRSKTLKNLAEEMVQKGGEFPESREKIEDLPGVGQYIANAIELFVHGRSRPLLDVNMARVLERYFQERELADLRDDPFLQEISQRVVEYGNPEKINFAILELAGRVCTKQNPEFEKCPLRNDCKYYNEMEAPKS
jgi:A/G-specific adenine glycosylase